MPTEYGIRPYAHSDVDEDGNERSFVDIISAPSWTYALSRAVQKHSEMMKPYLTDEDYPGMEQDYPKYSFPNPRNWDDVVPDDFNPSLGCYLTCNSPLYCEDPVFCHANRYQCPPQMSNFECLSAQSFKVTIDEHVHRKTSFNPAAVFPLLIYPPVATGRWNQFPDEPMNEVLVEMKDAVGNKCSTKFNAFCRRLDCCADTNTPVFAFDDASTPDTIAPGGSITVYVTGGCPPYTWSVSATGYSFTNASTSGPSNTLNAASGTCGTNYATFVTFTVTDKCGTSVSPSSPIMNTGATWIVRANFSPRACNVGGQCVCAAPFTGNTVYKTTTTGYPARWIVGYCGTCSVTVNCTGPVSIDRTIAICGYVNLLYTETGLSSSVCWGTCFAGGGSTTLAYWQCVGSPQCA